MNNKALLIGIDKYPDCPLPCCSNDVECLSKSLQFNYDGVVNFSVKKILDSEASRANIRDNLNDLFSGEGTIALFYFSGHGIDFNGSGYIVSHDFRTNDYGVSMEEILNYANKSKYAFKIIILDCCHAGFAGSFGSLGDTSLLGPGVIIMTASKKDEVSRVSSVCNHSVFTNLLIEAINGGASDILGNVSPGSIYSFIDQALGPWSQRPLFKANISSFVSIKTCLPKITIAELKTAMHCFDEETVCFALDPSYEKTNNPDSGYKCIKPYSDPKHVEIFTLLQKCNRHGLVIPVESPDMYFAAMDSKSCRLTPLGMHYWKMINEGII